MPLAAKLDEKETSHGRLVDSRQLRFGCCSGKDLIELPGLFVRRQAGQVQLLPTRVFGVSNHLKRKPHPGSAHEGRIQDFVPLEHAAHGFSEFRLVQRPFQKKRRP